MKYNDCNFQEMFRSIINTAFAPQENDCNIEESDDNRGSNRN